MYLLPVTVRYLDVLARSLSDDDTTTPAPESDS